MPVGLCSHDWPRPQAVQTVSDCSFESSAGLRLAGPWYRKQALDWNVQGCHVIHLLDPVGAAQIAACSLVCEIISMQALDHAARWGAQSGERTDDAVHAPAGTARAKILTPQPSLPFSALHHTNTSSEHPSSTCRLLSMCVCHVNTQ